MKEEVASILRLTTEQTAGYIRLIPAEYFGGGRQRQDSFHDPVLEAAHLTLAALATIAWFLTPGEVTIPAELETIIAIEDSGTRQKKRDKFIVEQAKSASFGYDNAEMAATAYVQAREALEQALLRQREKFLSETVRHPVAGWVASRYVQVLRMGVHHDASHCEHIFLTLLGRGINPPGYGGFWKKPVN